MTVHKYEIRKRGSGEHWAGFNSIFIDDVDTEYLNDPKQHIENATKTVLARHGNEKLDPAVLASEIDEECERISRHCLNRVMNRIRQGSLMPGGYVPIAFMNTGGAKAGKSTAPTSGSMNPTIAPLAVGNLNMTNEEREDYAVEHFLNRGNLSVEEINEKGERVTRPLAKDERVQRRARQNMKADHMAAWRAGRQEIVNDRKEKVKKLQEKLAKTKKVVDRDKIEADIAVVNLELEGLKFDVQMASHGYQYAYGQIMQAGVNFVTADMRIVPLMTNTTADTERDAVDAVSDFTTLDEFNGSGYTTGGLALANKAVNIDDANDRAEFDADDVVVTNLAAGTRAIDGILLIKFITNLNASLPVYWIEFGSDKNPDGSNFTFQLNTEGLVQAQDG